MAFGFCGGGLVFSFWVWGVFCLVFFVWFLGGVIFREKIVKKNKTEIISFWFRKGELPLAVCQWRICSSVLAVGTAEPCLSGSKWETLRGSFCRASCKLCWAQKKAREIFEDKNIYRESWSKRNVWKWVRFRGPRLTHPALLVTAWPLIWSFSAALSSKWQFPQQQKVREVQSLRMGSVVRCLCGCEGSAWVQKEKPTQESSSSWHLLQPWSWIVITASL